MRGVLTEKLKLDGIHFDGFILKDNLGNLLRGRFKAVKEQIGYKLPAILNGPYSDAPIEARETLFGDDAERDAFVYSLYGDLVADRIPPEVLEQVLDITGVYPDGREAIRSALAQVETCDPVERIIIHLDRKSPPVHFDAYGPTGSAGVQLLPGRVGLVPGRTPAISRGGPYCHRDGPEVSLHTADALAQLSRHTAPRRGGL